MADAPRDDQHTRWEVLTQEVHSLEDALSGFTLMGVLDRDTNHIASMEEEIDRRTREALVSYWLSEPSGDLPGGLA